MGYTHYFPAVKAPTTEQWTEITRAFKQLYINFNGITDLIQREDDDSSPPQADEHVIAFNGVGDEGYETFVIQAKPDLGEFEFCKTAQRPYDLMVCATLIIIDHYAPNCFAITSDGWHHEWEPAQATVRDKLGIEANIPEGIEHDPKSRPDPDA